MPCKTGRVTTANEPIRIVQLSDTHFLEPGTEAEGGFAYDTAEAFDAVLQHIADRDAPDLIVVTGDVADHGRPEQYRRAASAFSRFAAPVNVCPGNHDQDAAFTAGIGRPGVGTSRVIELGDWCFLFVDSNAGIMVEHDSGRYVDPPTYGERLHTNGALGAREASWIREMCSTTTAEHVFIWLHHPPAPPIGLCHDEAYAAEWRALLHELHNVRGLGGGHTHVPEHYEFEGLPVFVSPSLKNNFDLGAETLLPPGYRTFEFAADGSIQGAASMIDDPRWPRHPLGRAVLSLLRGELSYAQFDEIVARKRAAL